MMMTRVFRFAIKDGPTFYFTNFPSKMDVLRRISSKFRALIDHSAWLKYNRIGKRVMAEGMIEIEGCELVNNDRIETV
jgi:hypothetical protein